MDFFDEPAAWLPTGGVVIFLFLLFGVGCDSGVDPATAGAYLFWGVIALIAAIFCLLGNL